MAIDRIKSYGITEDKAKSWLGVQMSIQLSKYDSFLTKMKSYVVEIDEADELLETQLMGCGHEIKMTDAQAGTVEEKNKILNALKGNPYLTNEEIAKLTGIAAATITATLVWLIAKKLLEAGEGSYTPTEKAFNKETVEETEIYQVYKYGLRPDVTGSLISPTTRQFCKDMVALTSGKKRLTFEAINSKSNDMDEEYGINNAYDYKGGFYNDGEETTPFCRHVWVAETRIRRKK